MDSALAHRFEHHRPSTDTVAGNHSEVRRVIASAAEYLDRLLPESREKSLALTKLEEAMFWANAIIARAQVGGDVQ